LPLSFFEVIMGEPKKEWTGPTTTISEKRKEKIV